MWPGTHAAALTAPCSPLAHSRWGLGARERPSRLCGLARPGGLHEQHNEGHAHAHLSRGRERLPCEVRETSRPRAPEHEPSLCRLLEPNAPSARIHWQVKEQERAAVGRSTAAASRWPPRARPARPRVLQAIAPEHASCNCTQLRRLIFQSPLAALSLFAFLTVAAALLSVLGSGARVCCRARRRGAAPDARGDRANARRVDSCYVAPGPARHWRPQGGRRARGGAGQAGRRQRLGDDQPRERVGAREAVQQVPPLSPLSLRARPCPHTPGRMHAHRGSRLDHVRGDTGSTAQTADALTDDGGGVATSGPHVDLPIWRPSSARTDN